MVERFNNYLLNSIKVAVTGFLWFILFHIPYDKMFCAPIAGKIIFGGMIWAIWSFMVMVVAGEIGKAKQAGAGRRGGRSM